jgi:hypothetical protein
VESDFFNSKRLNGPGLWPAWSNYKVFKRELTGRHPSCTPTTVLPRTVGRRVLVARQPLPTMAAVLNPPAVPNKKAKKAKPAQKATNWAAFGFKKDVGYTPAKIRDDLPTELPVMKKSGATPWRPGTSSSPKTPANGTSPKKRKEPEGPQAPPKPLTAFGALHREEYKESHPDAAPTDVQKALKEKWEALTEEEQKPFVEAYDAAYATYCEELRAAGIDTPEEKKEKEKAARELAKAQAKEAKDAERAAKDAQKKAEKEAALKAKGE